MLEQKKEAEDAHVQRTKDLEKKIQTACEGEKRARTLVSVLARGICWYVVSVHHFSSLHLSDMWFRKEL